MPLRLHNAFDEPGFEIAAGRAHETDTIRNRAVKVYMDGALGSRGALLIEPYSDRPDTSGLSLMAPDALVALMARAEDADVQLAIHAIGDLANRRILEAFAAGDHSADNRKSCIPTISPVSGRLASSPQCSQVMPLEISSSRQTASVLTVCPGLMPGRACSIQAR